MVISVIFSLLHNEFNCILIYIYIATFENGLCYEFVPGSTLNSMTVYEPKIWRLVATNMALMHKLPLSSEQLESDAMLKTKTLHFLNLVPERFTNQTTHER